MAATATTVKGALQGLLDAMTQTKDAVSDLQDFQCQRK